MFSRFSLKDLFFTLIIALSSWAVLGVSSAYAEVLDVDFNDKTPGSFIGDGGAVLGEPVVLGGLSGEVIEETPGENFLEVAAVSTSTNAKSMHWDFLAGIEVTTGVVVVSFQFTANALDKYSFGIRESGGSAEKFLSIYYDNDGTFSVADVAGNISQLDNSYAVGVSQEVVLTFDMDAGTSAMTINNNEIFSQRAHGITTRGVGRFLSGFGGLSNHSPFYLDNVSVVTLGPSALLLDADFEDYSEGAALGVGGAAVDEPFSQSNNLYTEIVAPGIGSNQALYVENGTNGGGQNASWRFYDDTEVTTGLITIEYDVEFSALDAYKFSVRENGSSTVQFSTIRFTSSGRVNLYDEAGSELSVATYEANHPYQLRLTFDLDNGTYTVELDDVALVTDRSYGYSGEKGVGKAILGFDSSTPEGAGMYIDNFQVRIGSDDLIFGNGFDQ